MRKFENPWPLMVEQAGGEGSELYYAEMPERRFFGSKKEGQSNSVGIEIDPIRQEAFNMVAKKLTGSRNGVENKDLFVWVKQAPGKVIAKSVNNGSVDAYTIEGGGKREAVLMNAGFDEDKEGNYFSEFKKSMSESLKNSSLSEEQKDKRIKTAYSVMILLHELGHREYMSSDFAEGFKSHCEKNMKTTFYKEVLPVMLNESFADVYSIEMFKYLGFDAVLSPITQEAMLKALGAARGASSLEKGVENKGFNISETLMGIGVSKFLKGEAVELEDGKDFAYYFDHYTTPILRMLHDQKNGSGYSVAGVPAYPDAVNELERFVVSNMVNVLSNDKLFNSHTGESKAGDIKNSASDRNELRAYFTNLKEITALCAKKADFPCKNNFPDARSSSGLKY